MRRRDLLKILATLTLTEALSRPSKAGDDLRAMLEQLEGLLQQLELNPPDDDATVRYRNNQVATTLYHAPNATWRWPNGTAITNLAGSPNASWFWPNCKLMTNLVGSANTTWYWPDGKPWSTRGPCYTEGELRDVPRLAADLLRLAIRNGY